MLHIPVLVIMDIGNPAAVPFRKLYALLLFLIHIRHLCPVRELLQRGAVFLIKEVFHRHDPPLVLHMLQFSLRGIAVAEGVPIRKRHFFQQSALVLVGQASSRMVLYTLQLSFCIIRKGKEFPGVLLYFYQTERCFRFISKCYPYAQKRFDLQTFSFPIKTVGFLPSGTVGIPILLFFQNAFTGKQRKIAVLLPEKTFLFPVFPEKHRFPVYKLQMYFIIMVPVPSKHTLPAVDGIVKTAEHKRLSSAHLQVGPVIDKVSGA